MRSDVGDNSSNFLRNIIVLTDFVVVNAVMTACYMYSWYRRVPAYEGISIQYLLLCANTALVFAQLFFSTIVHKHYKAIDLVLRQITLLSMSFSILYVGLLAACKLLFGMNTPQSNFTLCFVAISVGALFVIRMVEYVMIKRLRVFGRNCRTVLFVGQPDLIAAAYNDIDIMPYAGLRLLGYYSDEPIQEKINGMYYLGTINDLRQRIENGGVRLSDEIYCTTMPNAKDTVSQLMDYSIRYGIQFNYIPPFLYEFGYCLKPRVEGELVVFSNLNEPLLTLGNRFIKRTFDIVVSGVTILMLLPFIPVIGIIIKCSSPGPIFFKQVRTGLNGKDFYMLKFRSMHVNADADRVQATKDDPRKFAFGNFMRKTNIDELPQFINVFLGDMSIVGPRPHMLAHTDEYRVKIYEYMLRHLVRPGITGWAQTTGYRGETPELWQMSGRVQRDLWYIQNWTFGLDVRIILRTAMQFFVHDEKAV